jgi:hypothetical protein
MSFLVLLPITDLVPIVVILTYHVCTMRNSPVYSPQTPSKKRFDRLYSIDDSHETLETQTMRSDSGVHYGSFEQLA